MRTFVHRVTVRVAYRYFTKRERADGLALVPPPADSIDPESRAMDREALRRLYDCLDDLPKRRRTVFVLCWIDGLEPSEASEVAADTMRSLRQPARLRPRVRSTVGPPHLPRPAFSRQLRVAGPAMTP